MALINSLSTGVSALKSFTKSIEVIGDNIANVNTSGFKSSRVDYTDSFSDTLQRSSASTSSGTNIASIQVGSGLQISAIKGNFGQGPVSTTGVNTDIAIVGDGFLKVRNPESGQDFLTRDGSFRMDDNDYYSNAQGTRLMGIASPYNQLVATEDAEGNVIFDTQDLAVEPTIAANEGALGLPGTMTIAGGQVVNNTTLTDAEVNALVPSVSGYEFDRNGFVNVTLSNGSNYLAGRVTLTRVSDAQALTREGGNLFSGAEAAGIVGEYEVNTNGMGLIKARALEQSNVNLAEQFAELITTQRSFQASSRIVTVSDEILNEIVNLKR